MRWMKVKEATAHAGGLATKTLYSAVERGELKVSRIGAGRNMVFAAEWIDEWLERKGQVSGTPNLPDRVTPLQPRPAA